MEYAIRRHTSALRACYQQRLSQGLEEQGSPQLRLDIAGDGSVTQATIVDTDLGDEPPPPPVILQRIPPRFSYELAMHASYGTLTAWRDQVPGWAGLGLRFGWGKNFGKHRIGPGLTLAIEGPVTVQWTTAIEPALNWDFVNLKGFALGVSGGVSALFNAGIVHGSSTYVTSWDAAPTLSARIGYSETWSRVGRRFFIYLEPKVRYFDEAFNPLVAIVVGSGRGY